MIDLVLSEDDNDGKNRELCDTNRDWCLFNKKPSVACLFGWIEI